MIIAIIILTFAVGWLWVKVNKLSKRPFIEITEGKDEFMLMSGNNEIKRFFKIEKK